MEAKFKIGDRVETEIGIGRIEEVFDRSSGPNAYCVMMEDTLSHCLFFEHELKLCAKEFSMDIRIDIANNVVIASLYEVDGNNARPVAKGNGHLIHEGVIGIAQAASYACLQLYRSLNGGKK